MSKSNWDTRYSWSLDDNGFVHIHRKKNYFQQDHIIVMTINHSLVNDIESYCNAICQTLADLDYKHRHRKAQKVQ